MKKIIKNLVVLLLLLAVAWFAAHWAVSSAWGRRSIERRIGQALEMDATVGGTRFEWPFFVVAEDVAAWIDKGEGGSADLTLKEVRAGLCGRRLRLRRPELKLRQGAAGDWQPERFRNIARLLDEDVAIESVLVNCSDYFKKVRFLDVIYASVFCREADGDEVALLGGMSWEAHPVIGVRGYGPVSFNKVSLQTRGGKVPVAEDAEFAWLSVKDKEALRLWGDVGRVQTLPPPAVVAPSGAGEAVSSVCEGKADAANGVADAANGVADAANGVADDLESTEKDAGVPSKKGDAKNSTEDATPMDEGGNAGEEVATGDICLDVSGEAL